MCIHQHLLLRDYSQLEILVVEKTIIVNSAFLQKWNNWLVRSRISQAYWLSYKAQLFVTFKPQATKSTEMGSWFSGAVSTKRLSRICCSGFFYTGRKLFLIPIGKLWFRIILIMIVLIQLQSVYPNFGSKTFNYST